MPGSKKQNWWNRITPLLWYYSWPLILSYGSVTGRGKHLDPESNRIICYLLLGCWLSHFVCGIYNVVVRRGTASASCVTLFIVAGCVYIVQVFAYLMFRPFDLVLLFPLVVPIALGIAVIVGKISSALEYRSAKCSVCGKPARFTLIYRKQQERRYCLSHMMDTLKDVLTSYKGKFIITDRQWSADSKSAQYYFYTPVTLAEDSYPQTDIDAVNVLLKTASDLDNVKAVQIPGESIKEIGEFDDQPLFILPLEAISRTPLNDEQLLALLQSTLSSFDREGHQFSMNMPYSDYGIYLWHNYI